MDISWLSNFADSWRDRIRSARLPHAVLLAGPAGVGKRSAAAWIAREKLGIGESQALPQYPLQRPEHPDLRWLATPDDKKTIGIDQVRELVDALSLTSYSGKGKVAVIEPADVMTRNAANSLLKTLEEPPGDALLVLIADRVGRLPATLFSRCQRIEFGPPDAAGALAWLDRLRPGATWTEALAVAAGAPLAAVDALESLDTSRAMARDFNMLARGEGSPVDVAARWSKLDAGYVLDWLAQQVQLATLAHFSGPETAAGVAIDYSVLQRMDSRNLFCYLDIINRLRGQPGGSYNLQLTLEGLLIDWMNGLDGCDGTAAADGMQLMLANRPGIGILNFY